MAEDIFNMTDHADVIFSDFELHCLHSGLYFLSGGDLFTRPVCTMPQDRLVAIASDLLAFRQEQKRLAIPLKLSEIVDVGWYWKVHPDGQCEIIEITDIDLDVIQSMPESEATFKGPLKFPD